jgi:uncharacterized protein (DUF488 family)
VAARALPRARHPALRARGAERVAGAVYSVGHSTLGAAAFLALLEAHGIVTLADVRAFPASRRHPHFGREALAAAARERGIAYRWMPELGGRRRPAPGPSRHPAWTVPAFRAYADYMDTPAFAAALAALAAEAGAAPAAFMCAEALWWRCHRRLVADALLAAGWRVLHIGPAGALAEHRLPDFARLEGGRVVYDVGVTPPLPGAGRARDDGRG